MIGTGPIGSAPATRWWDTTLIDFVQDPAPPSCAQSAYEAVLLAAPVLDFEAVGPALGAVTGNVTPSAAASWLLASPPASGARPLPCLDGFWANPSGTIIGHMRDGTMEWCTHHPDTDISVSAPGLYAFMDHATLGIQVADVIRGPPLTLDWGPSVPEGLWRLVSYIEDF